MNAVAMAAVLCAAAHGACGPDRTSNSQPASATPPPGPAEDAAAVRPAVARRLIGQPAPPEQPATVELLYAGREPRRRLRYSASPGARQRVHLKSGVASEIQLSGRRVARTEEQATEGWFDVTVVAAQGDRLELEIRFERADTIDLELYAAGRLGEARRTLDRMRGHPFRFAMDRRGLCHLPPLELPPAIDVDGDRDRAWEILESAVRSIVALPEEPIGVGARWRSVDEDRGQFGMPARSSIEVELGALRGQRLELSVAETHVVAPHPFYLTGPQVMGIASTNSSSSGRAVLDLARVHPIDAHSASRIEMAGSLLALSEQLPIRYLVTHSRSITAK